MKWLLLPLFLLASCAHPQPVRPEIHAARTSNVQTKEHIAKAKDQIDHAIKTQGESNDDLKKIRDELDQLLKE